MAVTGSGALPRSAAPPPPLVDLFGGDEAAAEAFREEKFMRDVKDAEDDIEFPDDDDDGRRRSSSPLPRTKNVTSHVRVGRTTHWTRCSRSPARDRPDAAARAAVVALPLERLAVLADAPPRRSTESVATIVQSDDRTVFDEIRDANADPLALRERQRAEANARNADLGWKRLKANRARHDGTRDDVRRRGAV